MRTCTYPEESFHFPDMRSANVSDPNTKLRAKDSPVCRSLCCFLMYLITSMVPTRIVAGSTPGLSCIAARNASFSVFCTFTAHRDDDSGSNANRHISTRCSYGSRLRLLEYMCW